MIYEVIVGNVGAVYRGQSRNVAWDNFHHYVEQSKTNPGNRCYGESVLMFENGELKKEYIALGHHEEDGVEIKQFQIEIRGRVADSTKPYVPFYRYDVTAASLEDAYHLVREYEESGNDFVTCTMRPA